MNPYKKILSRLEDNPSLEQAALDVPKAPKRSARPIARFAAIAAACLILIAGGGAVWMSLDHTDPPDSLVPGAGTPTDNAAEPSPSADAAEPAATPPAPSPDILSKEPLPALTQIPAIEDLRGLPTEPFIVTVEIDTMEHHKDSYFREVYDLFMPFFSPNQLMGFAVVYVLDTEPVEGGNQRATLQTLYSTGTEIPAVFTIEQFAAISVNPAGEAANQVRKGGTYVFPIQTSEFPSQSLEHIRDTDCYMVVGDEDVLFEVNDEGLIITHSSLRNFIKYDRMPLSYLWDEIVYLSEHPALTSALASHIKFKYTTYDTPFSASLPFFDVVLRGVVTECIDTKEYKTSPDSPTTTERTYNIDVSEFLHNSLGQTLQISITEDTRTGFKELNIGQEYIFNGATSDHFYFTPINEDGRIETPKLTFEHNGKAYDYRNAFDFAEGMTLEELRLAIDEICDYYGVPYNPSEP